MKKLITFGVVALSILGTSAFAESSNAAAATPEMTLLESLIALQGQELPQSELNARIETDLAAYSRQASPEGQQDRIEQALVELKIYTPEQAHTFIADSQDTVAKLMTQAKTESPSALQSDVNETMGELAALHPVGAEFSACVPFAYTAIVGTVVGVQVVIAGAIMDAVGNGSAGAVMAWGGAAVGVGIISGFIDFGIVAGLDVNNDDCPLFRE